MSPTITDVPDILVGHSTDEDGGTGCSVLLGPLAGMPCTVFVPGRALASRELYTCRAESLAGRVDAILLTGGSAYGLAAADGVMRWLETRGRGFSVQHGVVPIVPAAGLFDLFPCGRFDARPTPEMGAEACEKASKIVPEGSVGAGTGATVGKVLGPGQCMKAGIGTWSVRSGALVVGAMAAVNALGDVADSSGTILAGARKPEGGFVGAHSLLASGAATVSSLLSSEMSLPQTVLAVAATNARLDRVALGGVAKAMAHAIARRILPCSTAVDGDICFACSAGDLAVSPIQVEELARGATEMAIERAVRMAKGRDGVPGLADPTGS